MNTDCDYPDIKLYACLLCNKILTNNKPESLCELCSEKTNDILRDYDEYEYEYESDSEYELDLQYDSSSDLIKIEKVCHVIIYKNKHCANNLFKNITKILNTKCVIKYDDICEFIESLFDHFKIEQLYLIHLNIILNRINFDYISYDIVTWKIFLGFVMWSILELSIDEWYCNLDLMTYLFDVHNIHNLSTKSMLEYKNDIMFASEFNLIIYPDQVYESLLTFIKK